MKSVLQLCTLLALQTAASPVITYKQDAPVISAANAVEIPDSYIVVFKEHVTSTLASLHHEWVQEIHSLNEKNELRKRSQEPLIGSCSNGLKHTYNIPGGLLGYSGSFDDEVIEQIRSHPDVDYIEKDSIMHTQALEKNAPWGLARLSHRDALGFSTFNKYLYADDAGEGVDVYVIDTGVNIEHVDFEGRATWGKTVAVGAKDDDRMGHGTHCSGTVAGKKYGVAKSANIKAVKVLGDNGSGTTSDVIKGIEYAVESHLEQSKRKGFKGSVANMSLGGGKSTALNKAVNAAVDAGVHFAVAAGNENQDACNTSPASAENVVTVGASDLYDVRASFSNYGKCTDIFAPGVDIISTYIGNAHAITSMQGTSMASPHVAGLLAYLLSLQPSAGSAYAVKGVEITAAKLKADLIKIATKGALSGMPKDTPNLLAWNGGGSANYSEIVGVGSK